MALTHNLALFKNIPHWGKRGIRQKEVSVVKVRQHSLRSRHQVIGGGSFIALSLSFTIVAFVGCGGGGGPIAVETILSAILRGSQEVPPVQTNAFGTATVTINAARTQITVELNTSGLQNVTAVHIHQGAIGQNGPIIFTLYRQAEGPFPATLRKTLTAVDQGAPLSFADAVNSLLSGNTYINVHTQANPGGEIRGQIGPARFDVGLSGNQEVPPVTTSASGTAVVELNGRQTEIKVTMNTSGLQNVVAAHIHVGPAGQNGPIIFTLYRQADGPFPNPLVKTLTQTNLQAQPGAGINTFEDAVNALLSGNTYINVHTQANPGGEIRGQIVLGARLISFANEIQPIFNRSCAVAGCHASARPPHNLDLSAGVARGNLVNVPSALNPAFIRVVPGNADQSLLYLKVSQSNPPVGAQMPPQNPLPLEEQQKIRDWINQGALDN